ncbi:DUF4190 domain-containing protein [uncultured Agrococcus sp.]|uniref:DUF4190 domain-containing protein n=1 Tax=uncultured Agrococcus sp. TaxID=382258 RepID=UPI0025E01E83|nr:DUF4190 domain-containing protein [uncultured Agrococcus sp.]
MSLYPPAPVRPSAAAAGAWASPRQVVDFTEPGYEKRPTNVLAFFSLIAAASAWFLTGPLGSGAGLVLGFMSLSQLKKREEDGRELALIAIVFSAVSAIVGTVMLVSLVTMVFNSAVV